MNLILPIDLDIFSPSTFTNPKVDQLWKQHRDKSTQTLRNNMPAGAAGRAMTTQHISDFQDVEIMAAMFWESDCVF